MTAERVPEYAEHPGYGVYPCDDAFHTTRRYDPTTQRRIDFPDRCPNCGNTWWAIDGTECPEDRALVAEIDALRDEVDRLYAVQLRAILHRERRNMLFEQPNKDDIDALRAQVERLREVADAAHDAVVVNGWDEERESITVTNPELKRLADAVLAL